MKHSHILLALAAAATMAFSSCSDDDTPEINLPEGTPVEGIGKGGDIAGFYVLNEGNMGANKCTLDYLDYSTGTYIRNIYESVNPEQVLALGDTGNDMAVYKGRLYIVVNGSHKVEVLDARSAKRIGKVDISSPRYLAFDGDFMYVTSYVGGTGDNGSVVRVDLNSLQVTGSVSAGLCPEEMVVTDHKLYAANSANFSTGTFDDKITVVDLNTFTVAGSVTAAINMNHLRLDKFGNMWANSRGNYNDQAECLVMLKKNAGEYALAKKYDVPCSNMALAGDKMYWYGVTYDASWNATNSFNVAQIDADGLASAPAEFITDGSASSIATPYCIAVQPSDGTVIITDAKNYTSSGNVLCYSPEGRKIWQATAGDIPGHVAFVKK